MENLDDFKIPDEALERLKDPEVLKQYVAEGKTFQEIIGYDDATMERFYQAAYALFQKQAYAGAADAFIFLTTLNPYVHNYWIGLGMTEIKNEEYESALVALGMAGMAEPDNPLSSFHSAHCYHLMGDYQTAVTMLQTAIDRCGEKEQYAAIKADATEAQRRIKTLIR